MEASTLSSPVEGDSRLPLPMPTPAGLARLAMLVILSFVSVAIISSFIATGLESGSTTGVTIREAQSPSMGPTGCAVWNVASPPDIGFSNNLRDVEVLSNSSAWAVGTYNTSGPVTQATIYRWNGSSWSLVPSPQGYWSELNGVSALSPNDIWAVGSWSNSSTFDTLVEHWNGSTWSVVPSPNVPGASHNYLQDVAAIAPNDVWAVGNAWATNSARISLTLHWDGVRWSIVPSPTAIVDTSLYSVSASGPNDVWAVGSVGQKDFTLAMHWDGSEWSVVQSNNPDYGTYLREVVALAPDNAWAVGTYHTRAVDWPLIAHWDGVSWTQWPGVEYAEGQLEGIAAAAPNDIWAVGLVGEQNSTTLTLHWDGSTWQRVSSPNVGSAANRPMAVDALPGGDAWAVGAYTNDNTLYRNLGLRLANSCGPPPTATPEPVCNPIGTWQETVSANAYVSENHPQAISGLGPDAIWSVGYHHDINSPNLRGLLAGYLWDGTDWFTMAVPSQPGDAAFYGVEAIDLENVYAVGYRNYNNMDTNLITRADGDQWEVVQSPSPGYTPNYLYGISATSPADIWAVGSYFNVSAGTDQTMIIHKDASQWSIVPSPNVGTGRNVLRAVSALAPDDVWAVGYYNAGPGTREQTLTMHWNGSAWSIVSSPNAPSGSSYLYSVSGNFDGELWAAGYSVDLASGATRTLILKWDDTSNQWNMISSPNPGSVGNLLRDISVARGGGTEAWAVGSFSSSSSLTQTLTLRWDQATAEWSQVPSPNPGQPTNQFTGVLTFSQYEAWAVGNRGGPNAFSTLMERYRNNNPCGACSLQFTDVPADSTFYPFIRCLACRGIISGYADGTFKPNNQVTRGQLAKIVSNAAGFTESPDPQIFEDVPSSNTFYEWINRLTRRGYMGGYPCGGPGEPCTTGMPYFRPSANATRGQTSKIVSNTAGYSEEATDQTFEDVPLTHTFYQEIQRLASRNIMQGYPCGGVGEPCISGKPYFRPANNVTRGQSAKIVANTFFPGCDAR